jgi:hypothetical protein
MTIKEAEKTIKQAKDLQKRLKQVNQMIKLMKTMNKSDLCDIAGNGPIFEDDLYYEAVALKNRLQADIEALAIA